MQAPDSNAQASPSPTETGMADVTRSRRVVGVVGATVLAAGTVFALWQSPQPEPLRELTLGSAAWWRYPVEHNAVQRLAVSKGPLMAVYARPGSDEVWFAGAGGLVSHSTDGGVTWQSVNLQARRQTTRPPGTPAKAADASRARSREQAGTPMSLVSFRSNQDAYPRQAVQQYPVTVPNVLGMKRSDAQGILAKLQLRDSIQIISAAKAAPGTVVSQTPSAGTRVSERSVVVLTILAPTPTIPPKANVQSPPKQAPPDSQILNTVPPTPPLDTGSFYPRFAALCFSTSREGWVVGDGGAVFHSVDAGETWTQIPTRVRSTFTTVACNGTTAVAGGDGAFSRLSGDASQVLGPLPMTHVTFTRGGAIWSAQTSNGAVLDLMQSSDTGHSWYRRQRVVAFAFSDSLNGVAFDSLNRVMTTVDAGQTWSAPRSCSGAPAQPAVKLVVPLSATNGLAVDQQGRVWRTADGWSSCSIRRRAVGAFAAAAATNADRWYAVGTQGALQSTDGGVTWHTIISPTRLFSVYFRDSLHGVAALDAGVVGRTSDGGRSWSFTHVDSVADRFRQFAARGDEELFAATPLDGSGIEQWHSRDGGSHWAPSPQSDSMMILTFVDDRTGWALADTTYLTRDGGQTWTRASMPGSAGIKQLGVTSLSFLTNRGNIAETWVTTKNLALLRYRNARWDTLATGIAAASIVTSSLAFGVDTLGNLTRSTDGGKTWNAAAIDPPRKYPAPWYYAFALLTVGATLATSRRQQRKKRKSRSRSPTFS